MKRYTWAPTGMIDHDQGQFYYDLEADTELKRRDDEIASLRKDAERYRWFRSNADNADEAKALDEKIDAAMNVPSGNEEPK